MLDVTQGSSDFDIHELSLASLTAMHLGRAQVSTVVTPPVSSISFSHDSSLFAIAGEAGYEVWSTWPLRLLRRRKLQGTLHMALPLAGTPLLALQGGGPSPLYPPNKVVLYHDGLNQAVAELEFGERIRGIISRPGGLLVALLRRTIWYQYGMGNAEVPGFWIEQHMEWATATNELGLMSVSTVQGSSTLALPGRQPGHVQLIHLPCATGSTKDTTSFRSPILLCHTHPLSALACSLDGKHVATASERGTLIRVWDTSKGRLERELRRGMDRVEMWGLTFDGTAEGGSRGGRVLGWSDKGTIHVWTSSDLREQLRPSSSKQGPSLQTLITRNLPKYFSSETSKQQYHLPRKNPHAFSSVASAATAVPGLRPKPEYGQTNEIDLGDTERFVACWVTVENKPDDTKSTQSGMGSREDRLSFSSDTTATPQLRFQSGSSQNAKYKRTSLGSAPPATLPPVERQIIAITHGGDWYRLRLPELRLGDADEGDERAPSKMECELVEYRRLGIGGGGW